MKENDLWMDAVMAGKRRAFGDAVSLYECRFERDNGLVAQMKHARRYFENWQKMRRNSLGLLFWGQCGSGKTFAAACIANALIEAGREFHTEVRMATFGNILTDLLAKSPQDKKLYQEELLGCDLLILDDFGMERRTEYTREQVFNIVDGRYLSGLPLIVTTNLSLQELKNPGNMADRRIYDRLLEMCVPVCFDGESLRQGRARERLQLYRQISGM